MSEKEYDIGTAELEVLSVLWELGPSTVRAVLNHLHGRGRRVAYTTVLTYMTRLEAKGLVRTDKSQQAYVYRAAVTQSKVRRSRVRQLLDQLYDGASAPLALQLIRQGRFTEEELDELRQLIDRLEAKRGGPQPD